MLGHGEAYLGKAIFLVSRNWFRPFSTISSWELHSCVIRMQTPL